MRLIRVTAMSAVLLSATACVDVYAPWGTSGTYELYSANGRPVPAVIYARGGTRPWTLSLIGGEMRLRGDHTFRLDLTYRDRDGSIETVYTQGLSGTWEREDDTVWLDFQEPETGEWVSVAVNRRRSELEFNVRGAVPGSTVRILFVR
jgi:hypothetical protein